MDEKMFDELVRCTMILNNVIALDDAFVSAEDVRAMMPEQLRIIKNKQFTNFDSKGQLWKSLFGTVA